MDLFDQFTPKDLKSRKIKGKFKETIEPQEILLDKLAQRKEEEMGISEKKLEVPLSSKILRVFYFLSIVAVIFLFAQTFYLQIIKGKDFLKASKNNSQRVYFIRSDRGVIYDKNGEQLVSNLPSFDLVLDKRDLPKDENEKKKIISDVSNIIKKNSDDFQKEIENSTTPEMLILENIQHETLLLLEPKMPGFAGFRIEKNTIRDYKSGSVFAHLMGYTGKINQTELSAAEDDYSISDYIGKDGLEKYYEEILRGKPGKIIIEKDVLGQKQKETTVPATDPGKNLVLYLDAGLQKKIQESLSATMANVGVKAGVAIAMDPKTGGILSLVSLPSFDNNLFSQGISVKDYEQILNNPKNPLFNRVISGGYVTGSTIKPFMGSAALQESIIKPNTTVNCQGEISIPNPYDPDIVKIFSDLHAHGITDLRKAIAQSCNVFFYTIGGGYKSQKGLGVTLIKKYLNLFGWGEKTGVDLFGEINGFIPDPAWKLEKFKDTQDQNWYTGDTYNLSIGQGYISVTPLQVVSAFATIANNGKLFEPHIVQKIIDNDKNTIEEIQPKIIRENFISSENLEVVREGMRDAVIYGSSVSLNSLPVKVAAKTGTAQTPLENRFHNWITVFAPYDNPEIVLTIMMENVPGLQAAVLPVARDVLNWYFTRE